MRRRLLSVVTAAAAALFVACTAQAPESTPPATASPAGGSPALPQETHLRNITQLTFGGENAEAYFSPDGKRLTFQSTRDGRGCDQIYTMNIDGSDVRMLSSGKGRTTCSFYYPDGQHILYASTHLGGDDCPKLPELPPHTYAWGVFDSYDIFRVDLDGSNMVRLTSAPGYDAEATIANDGRVVFTSVRDGDMEIYSMNGDGSDVRRLTHLPGPDGGPFFSPDGSRIVFRGYHPAPGPELENYFALLKKAVWEPATLDVFVMDRDGSHLKQVTSMPGANWAPYWTPDGQRIIFASDTHDQHPVGRAPNFDIFLINLDGSGLEQVTFNESFDGFPMFSPDGTKLVFASNRNDTTGTETNVFIADWVK